jgi:hypothetical protein
MACYGDIFTFFFTFYYFPSLREIVGPLSFRLLGSYSYTPAVSFLMCTDYPACNKTLSSTLDVALKYTTYCYIATYYLVLILKD